MFAVERAPTRPPPPGITPQYFFLKFLNYKDRDHQRSDIMMNGSKVSLFSDFSVEV